MATQIRKDCPSYPRNLLANVLDIHHYNTRGAARGHLHVNQVSSEIWQESYQLQISPIKERLLTDTLCLDNMFYFINI